MRCEALSGLRPVSYENGCLFQMEPLKCCHKDGSLRVKRAPHKRDVDPECFLLGWLFLYCWVPPQLSLTIPQPGLGHWQPLVISCGCCFVDLLQAERDRS